MQEKTPNIEDFCKKNKLSFQRYINTFVSDKIFLSPICYVMIAALSIFTTMNYLKYGFAHIWPYLPAVATFLIFRLAFELGRSVKRSAIFWLEAFNVSLLMGFNAVLWLIHTANQGGKLSGNGSMAVVLLTINLLTFWRSNRVLASKVLGSFIIEALVLYLINPELLALFKVELVFGATFSFAAAWPTNYIIKLQFYHSETGSVSLHHAYSQLQKLVFPHQLNLMKSGQTLEETMPVGSGEASVLCYDVQKSSHLPQGVLNQFMQKVLDECHLVFEKGYTQSPLRLTAFKLKELGDGFICTIGFPFATPSDETSSDVALRVACECLEITRRVKKTMGLDEIYCSIGIASGKVHSFFTRVGIKAYDVYGAPLVLAKRYEEFRKHYPQISNEDADIIVVQAVTFESCKSNLRERFQRLDLHVINIKVRDDADATHLYLSVSRSDATLKKHRIELMPLKAVD